METGTLLRDGTFRAATSFEKMLPTDEWTAELLRPVSGKVIMWVELFSRAKALGDLTDWVSSDRTYPSLVFEYVIVSRGPQLSITTQPRSQIVFRGENADFMVAASGTPPLTYQWRLNGKDIPGATGARLTVNNVTTNHAGTYTVLVSDSIRSVVSSEAILTVNPPGLIYSTGFEISERYDAEKQLAGQNGWQQGGTGGNGLKSNLISGQGQQAFIGSIPPSGTDTALVIAKPVNFTPSSGSAGFITFSVLMQITDSPNRQYDDFQWQVYNTEGRRLFTLAFDNQGQGVYYRLDDDAGFVFTEQSFRRDIPYRLAITLDFSRNTCGATLGNTRLVAGQPITTKGAALNLGDIRAVWVLHTQGSAGNNLMLFDDFRVVVPTQSSPIIWEQPQNQSVGLSDVVTFVVVAGGKPPLTYQWRHNGRILSGEANPALVLSNVRTNQAGSYSVSVSNSLGSVSSSVAELTVSLDQFKPGSLDNRFQPGYLGNADVHSVAIQPDGKVIIGGTFSTVSETRRERVARLNRDGSLDGSFDPGFGANGFILSMALQADGKMVVAGFFTSMDHVLQNYITRLNADGTLDSSFNAGSGANAPVQSVVLQRDGKLLIGGRFTSVGGVTRNRIARLNQDGSVDATFNPGPGADDAISSVAVQSDDKVLIGGAFTSVDGLSRNRIARLNSDGSADIAFNPGSGANGVVLSSVVQHDGKILIGGDFTSFDSVSRNRIARLNSGGGVDTAFDPGSGADNTVHSVAVQDDGKVFIGGKFSNFNGTRRDYIARLNSNGSLDPVFDAGLAGFGYVYSIAIQANSKVLIGGNFGNRLPEIIRLNGDPIFAPTIAVQPTNRAVRTGDESSFAVEATGIPMPSYQWEFNGIKLTGATNAVLRFKSVQASNAGSYRVVISNAVGSVTSQTAVLTVGSPPTITKQPQNQNIIGGANVSFTVSATGSAPLSYQWLFNGNLVSRATAATLSLSRVQFSEAGNYNVVVSNAVGTVTSAVANLVISSVPSITVQPKSVAVKAGDAVMFAVTATGTASLIYQWRFNNRPIGGADSATFRVNNVQSANAGSYSVVVSNAVGSVTSAAATLTVAVPPAITKQPQSQNVVAGANVSFSVTATGSAPLVYQWLFNGVPINRATMLTLSLPGVQFSQGGSYSVVVSNAVGTVTSETVTLAVSSAPSITVQPKNVAVKAGDTATLTVTAAGTPPLSYQWRFNGKAIGGANVASLTLNNVQAANAGSYNVVVSNAVGSVTSAAATLTVAVPPAITKQPQSQNVVAGANVSFSVTATGSAPLVYQWLFNGVPVNRATTLTLSLPGVKFSQGGSYSVVVSNAVGTVTSETVTLAVSSAPSITVQPKNVALKAGDTATFAVTAAGTALLAYEWRFNNKAIAGANLAAFTLNNVQAANAGSYSVVISNAVGSVTSTAATLTVATPPAITKQPQSQNAVAGANVTFSVSATGSAPLGYQWLFNGTAISKATAATLSLAKVQFSQAGRYSVVVSNAVGTVTSEGATLAVSSAPSITVHPKSVAVKAGDTATFTVAAAGTAPLTYQWRFNNNAIAGANLAAFTLNNVQAANVGSYSVAVSNQVGSVTSAAATLTVAVPPAITKQPQSQNVVSGANVSFSVTATGSAPLAYQWLFNGAPVSRATTATLSLSRVQSSQAGSYSVVVSNAVGTARSDPATLAVQSAPTIATQPLNQTVKAGDTAMLTVIASGTAPLNYQWRLNGKPIAGGDSATLTLRNAQAANAGSYSVAVSNLVGSVTSTAVTLTVATPPTITKQPQSLTVVANANATFTVIATGSAPLSYQWLLNGSPVSRATATTLSLIKVQSSQAGSYSVIVSNAVGTIRSDPANLVIERSATRPLITSQPQSQTVIAGGSVTLSVEASGTAPLSYQWNLNEKPVRGAISPSLVLNNFQTSIAGSYTVVVSNSAGSVTSGEAKLIIQQALVVLAPVSGKFRVTGKDNPDCTGAAGLWTFCQHQTDFHQPAKGIAQSDETHAWDINLLEDADKGLTVFAVASGKVVKYAGLHEPGKVSGSVLIEHSANGSTWWSGYLHMSDIGVTNGQQVTTSTSLGRIGNICDCGAIPNHLHFVVYEGSNTKGGLKSRDVQFVERQKTLNTPDSGRSNNGRMLNAVEIVSSANLPHVGGGDVPAQFSDVRKSVMLNATRVLPEGPTILTIRGPDGRSCLVEASDDLLNWKRIATLVLTGGNTQFHDGTDTNGSQRFYRVVLPGDAVPNAAQK